MDKPWLAHYPAGVPRTVDVDEYDSLLEIIERSCSEHADKRAYINMGAELTFRDFDAKSRAFAAYLQQELRLAPGSRVALMMPNLLQYPVALFGVLRAGMVAVNVNPLYTARELQHQLVDAEAEAILLATPFAHTLASVLPQTQLQHVILTDIGDMLPLPKRTVINLAIKYVKKMVPEYSLPGARRFRQALQQGARLDYQRPQLSVDSLALLQYTGGTTGVAKGAMLSHGNLIANLQQIVAAGKPRMAFGQELMVTPLPLYHIFSLTANMLSMMRYGGCNLLITNPRDIKGLVKELGRYPFTAISGVSRLFQALVDDPDFAKLDFSHLKLSLGGGMPIDSQVAKRWKQITGVALLEGYGLTECSPIVCTSPITMSDNNNSVGVPLPSTEIKVVDSDSQPLGFGLAGELWVRGPQVMQGYWKRPEESAEVLKADGWLATGDIAVIDEQGFVRLVDRKKDLVLVSGFNVYPSEIELVVEAHPDVVEAAAIGVADPTSGEAVKLFVVTHSGMLSAKTLLEHCRQRLTGYKIPKYVEFRQELPKNPLGKVLRRELREA